MVLAPGQKSPTQMSSPRDAQKNVSHGAGVVVVVGAGVPADVVVVVVVGCGQLPGAAG